MSICIFVYLLAIIPNISSAPLRQENVKSFYYPKPNTVFNTPVQASSLTSEPVDAEAQQQAGINFMMQQLGMETADNVDTTNSFVDQRTGIMHQHCTPIIDGVKVANSQAAMSVDKFGNVISFSESWASPNKLTKRQVTKELSPRDAVVVFANAMDLEIDPNALTESPVEGSEGTTKVTGAPFASRDVVATNALYRTEASLENVVSLKIPMATTGHYYNAFVSVQDRRLVGLSDLASNSLYQTPRAKALRAQKRSNTFNNKHRKVKRSPSPQNNNNNNNDFTYTVVPFTNIDLSQGRQVVTNPQDLQSSPAGWHTDATTTQGNNVIAQENADNSASPENNGDRPATATRQFSFGVNDNNQEPPEYQDASITNMFFVANTVHDIYFRFGFNEAAGNFQNDNFGKGGAGGDAVIASAQDGSGLNNANFLTPEDGQPGEMRMFVFDSVQQGRDRALDNSVIIHELTHGLSNRLTGGPDAANCLQSQVAVGLGEGWSDFFAFSLLRNQGDNRNTNFVVGSYVTNDDTGVRDFPYSDSLQANPRTYSDLQNIDNLAVHNVGEIWASMLIDVHNNMVDKDGFSANLTPQENGGNIATIQMVMDAMKIQPCNPTFIQARDAILTADRNNNNGANACEISRGFAKRGLGVNAVDNDDF